MPFPKTDRVLRDRCELCTDLSLKTYKTTGVFSHLFGFTVLSKYCLEAFQVDYAVREVSLQKHCDFYGARTPLPQTFGGSFLKAVP